MEQKHRKKTQLRNKTNIDRIVQRMILAKDKKTFNEAMRSFDMHKNGKKSLSNVLAIEDYESCDKLEIFKSIMKLFREMKINDKILDQIMKIHDEKLMEDLIRSKEEIYELSQKLKEQKVNEIYIITLKQILS